MSTLGNTVYQFLCCVVLCSILFFLFPDGRMKSLVRTFFGIFITVVLLSSIVGIELPDLEGIGESYMHQAQTAAVAGKAYALEQYREIIKQRMEAYILDIAGECGCALTVRVEVDGEGYPVSAELWGDITSGEQKKLEAAIAEELGIAKEDQQWNGLQTRKDSALP